MSDENNYPHANGAVQAPGYPQTKLNTVRVYGKRGHYDYRTVHSIVASTFVSHVAFTITDEDGEPTPINMPLTAVMGRYDPDDPLPEDDGDEEEYVRQQEATVLDGPADLYLHTNAASLLYKSIREKGSVRVFDGVVLSFTPNGHSLNYRSAILHGDASLVSDPAEKRYAMHLLTNHMSRRRWSATNPVSPAAMKSVQVMRVRVRSASAKIRAANVGEFEPQLATTAAGPREDVWTGVVPVYEVLGEPVGSGVFPERTVQGQVEEWRVGRNEREKSYAERVAQPSEVEVKMRELVLQS